MRSLAIAGRAAVVVAIMVPSYMAAEGSVAGCIVGLVLVASGSVAVMCLISAVFHVAHWVWTGRLP